MKFNSQCGSTVGMLQFIHLHQYTGPSVDETAVPICVGYLRLNGSRSLRIGKV